MKPLAVMLHGVHGIGKTSFALDAPNPVYVGSEEADEYDMARFPRVENWGMLIEQLKALRDLEHDFKTIVIDTTDSLEQVAEKAILASKGNEGKTMATAFGGYGKAYERMSDMFLDVRDDYLVPLRDKRGMNVVLLSHCEKVKHEDPMTNTSYDQFIPANHKKVRPIWEDWVSVILFVNYYLVRAENSAGKEYAQGADGLRMVYTEERPSHVAKNRFSLPYEMEFTRTGFWQTLREHVLEHFKKGPRTEEQPVATDSAAPVLAESPKGPQLPASDPEYMELAGNIDDLMTKIPEANRASIGTAVQRAGRDVTELQRIVTKMMKIIN